MATKRGQWVEYQYRHDPCVYCGKRFYQMTIDHIDPRCLGATRRCTVDNSAVACRWCNQGKGDTPKGDAGGSDF